MSETDKQAMLVVFDCDGVLIDSETIFCTVDAEALTRLGHPTTASEISERFAGVPHQTAWSQLSAQHNLKLPADWVENLLLECDRRFQHELAPIPGAANAIKAIVDRGDQACVASSTELPSLRGNLDRAGLLTFVEPNVFSVSQVKRAKPAPDIFLYAASQMGFDPSETVVIEDSVIGVLAAKRAGMRVFGFTGGGHAYSSLGSRLSEAGAMHVCRSMDEVTDCLSSQ
ncbi:HAD family phosphatase [Pseudomonas oryzihabitans]|uniref:HAD family hydrolase n=1 Tax=Pseudomonas oryzihabitans TaxID=47885 RepID=UPI00289486AE|nr:HAD family phosphatase [Pseudomonas oryzihabitans]MDT3723208.1 HAD family phosphatase [Pseudomonas oryzihabitans]